MKRIALLVCLLCSSAYLYAQGYGEYPFIDNDPRDSLAGWRRHYFEGYTQSPSIAQGQTVEFKASTLATCDSINYTTYDTSCALRIYRLQDTSMAGDRDMNVYLTFQARFHPLHGAAWQEIWPGDTTYYPFEYRRGCGWPTNVSYQIPGTWPSGFYYAKLFIQGHEQGNVGYIPFVVRSSSPGDSSKTLLVVSWNTYEAYNFFGGGSLYWETAKYLSPDTTRATIRSMYIHTSGVCGQHRRTTRATIRSMYIHTVSFRRPFTTQWAVVPSNYATEQLGQVNQRERAFIAWAERAGYRMEYCVDGDVHQDSGGFLAHYRTIVIPGHSEYWSREQREALEYANLPFRSQGGNIAFFGANNCYWKVNYYPATPLTNNPDSMYCDMEWLDSADTRGVDLWRHQGGWHGEARLVGVQFMGTNNVRVDSVTVIGVHVPNRVKIPNHWIFKGTNLSLDQEFGRGSSSIYPLAALEVDMMRDTVSPAGTQRLGRVNIRRMLPDEIHGNEGVDSIYADVAYYEDEATNSRVFAGGGLGWSGCLYGDDATTMRTITSNILDHFSGKKYIGNIYRNLTWSQEQLLRDTVEIDGDSRVISSRQLLLGNGMRVVIDSAVALSVAGELQIPSGATATITGFNNTWGSLVINNGGTLRVKSGATLKLTAPLYFVMETGANLALESGATLKINASSSTGDSVVINVPSNATLRLDSLAGIFFGVGSRINVSGTLVVQGTAAHPVLLTRSTGNNDYWSGITLNEFASATLSHCNILHAQVGVSGNSIQPAVAQASSK